MFTFTADHYDVIERNIRHGEVIEKYPDCYMIVMNGHVENEAIHGDIVAVLTKDEYVALIKPRNLAPRFGIWKGSALIEEDVNNLIVL
jgi:hypothetical protein